MADATDAPKTKEQRHLSLYFDDGDLVILANSEHAENPKQIFRVHKALLSIHSPVFKDMLVVGDDAATERYDGVPLVRLPDFAEDTAGLLNALYLRPLPMRKLDPDNPLKVRGIMKLATKYEMEAIRKTIIERIVADWPLTLIEWEAREREQEMKVISVQSNENPEFELYSYQSFPDPASAIRFAMDFKCYELLPAAFYALVRGERKVDWEHCLISDEGGVAARWELLEASDLIRLFAGRMTLNAEVHDTISRDVAQACQHRKEPSCEEMLGNAQAVRSLKRAIDPLGYYLYLADEKIQWCCFSGLSAFEVSLTKAAQQLWDRLPEIFDLEDLA